MPVEISISQQTFDMLVKLIWVAGIVWYIGMVVKAIVTSGSSN